MKTDNIVLEKSFAFAIRIVNLRKYLCYDSEQKEFDISRQLMRSGTSVGANLEEAIGAQSDADFISKIAIAYKEARESKYWIRLLFATDYITEEMLKSLETDTEELCKIIGKIQITTKNRIAPKRNS
ncbi:MAG: four helix bundle protein [Sphingobacteriia bacterium]|nr:four helix bundle protein [Sphingobacteriia bacterium]